MKQILFFIFLFVGANCLGLSPIDHKEIRESDQFCQLNNKLLTELRNSVDQVREEQNETSSTVGQLSADVAEIKKLMKDLHNLSSSNSEILASISKDLQKAHVIQFSEENNQTSSISNDTQETVEKLDPSLPKREVLCNKTKYENGWLVIQKRQRLTTQVDFNRTWASYKEGFGDLDTEFWIGNECLHQVTKNKTYELHIAMKDLKKRHFFATYGEFRVGNEESGYKLHVGGVKGNVYNSLQWHSNNKFSTFDRDNDGLPNTNCAKKYSGGFWYSSNCYAAHLNGLFPTVPDWNNDKLIVWFNNGEILILINVEMKIRPKQ